jgi:hypothetical protein
VNPVANTQGLANTALLQSVGSKANGNGGYFGVTSAEAARRSPMRSTRFLPRSLR